MKLIQHAVSTGAREVRICDEGEDLDESISLTFRYDSQELSLEALESEFRILQDPEQWLLSPTHLGSAFFGALNSGLRCGPVRLGLRSLKFFSNVDGRCCALDLLTGKVSWRETTEQKWTYSLVLSRDRPLFTYSLFGHPEIREVRQACSVCPINVTISGKPVVQAEDGFLHSPMLLHVDSRHFSPSRTDFGDLVWVPHNLGKVPLSAQVAIPRRQTASQGYLAGGGFQSETGHMELHRYTPPQRDSLSSIIPVIDGVTMESVVIDARLRLSGNPEKDLPFTAIAACPEVRSDHSHGQVVQDNRWQALVERVKAQADSFSEALSAWNEGWRD